MSTAPSQRRYEPARILIAMGVSSSGKTSVGVQVARRLGAPFLEGDDYHPAANVAKMSAGTPLTDADRWPWLENLAKALHATAEKDGFAVAACSALKRSYRDFLIEKAGEPILFIYLHGSKQLIASRIAARKNHFMPPSLLDSQFATLEIPDADENVITVGIEAPVAEITERVMAQLPEAMRPKGS
jgi:carbohydrate kinase (thermoresistant glucokinase family)